MNLHGLLTECAVSLLDKQREVLPHEVVACARERRMDLFEEESNRLAMSAAGRVVKDILRGLSNDEDQEGGQLVFPNLALPSAIAVQKEDGTYYYVKAEKACWHEVCAGREERVLNVSRAQEKLDHYDETLEALKPYMAKDPDLTVAAALRLMRE